MIPDAARRSATSHVFPSRRAHALAAALVAVLAGTACIKKTKNADLQSDPDGLTAVSNNPWGDNRRVIVWALSVTNPATFVRTVQGSGATAPVAAPANTAPRTSVRTRIVQNLTSEENAAASSYAATDAAASNASALDLTKKHFQCWYAARVSPTGGEPTPEQLVQVFLDSSITQPIAGHFIAADDLYNGLQSKETTRRVLAFSGSTLSAGACGFIALIPEFKQGAILSPLCAIALAAITNGNAHLKGGDATWGAASAKDQIHSQGGQKVDELTAVPFDVINALEKEVDSYDNDPERVAKKTNVPCPSTSQALVEYMGTKTAGKSAVPGDGNADAGAANGAPPAGGR